MVQQRNIALNIILSIVTCGIYGLYWYVCITDDVNAVAEEQGTTGVMALLLTIITCGIYGIYWAYKTGEKIDAAKEKRGMSSAGNSNIMYLIMYLVLCYLGLGCVVYALIQNELNKLAEA